MANATTPVIQINEGNVGIGTTSPIVKLHVNGTNASVGTIGIPKNDWYTTAYNGIQVGDGTTLWGRAGDSHFSGNYYVKNNNGSAQDTYINALSAHDLWLDNSSGSLKYRNASLGSAGNAITFNTRFVVLNNGNFGIGVTSPNQKLHVNDGGVRVEKNATGLGGFITIGNATETAGNYSAYFFGNSPSDTNYFKGGIAYETLSATFGRGDMHFLQNDSSNATNATISDSVMTILNGGNVGIGTTSPGVKLQVEGSIQANAQGRFKGWYTSGSGLALETGVSGGNGYVLTYNRDTSAYSSTIIESTGIQFAVHSSGKFYFTNGNVGIGTTSPLFKLQTNATITGGWLGYLNGTSATFGTNNFSAVHNSTAIGTGTESGINLANNASDVGAPSPIIFFSAKSASGSYQHAYAAIYGIKTATGADTNWNKVI